MLPFLCRTYVTACFCFEKNLVGKSIEKILLFRNNFKLLSCTAYEGKNRINLVAGGDEVRRQNNQQSKEVLTMLKEKLRGGGYP